MCARRVNITHPAHSGTGIRGERQTHRVRFETTIGYRNALTVRLNISPPGNTKYTPDANATHMLRMCVRNGTFQPKWHVRARSHKGIGVERNGAAIGAL